MPTSDIGIDLGTRNSLAYSTGKGLVLNEPSIVVYDKNTEKIRAIGEEARLMERAHYFRYGDHPSHQTGRDR